MTMDDGCDLVSLLHQERPDQLPEVLAGTEETTTGVIRLTAMAADGALAFPVVAVNEAQTKHLFDNRYGTGQSTVDGILRATNILLAGPARASSPATAGSAAASRRASRAWAPRSRSSRSTRCAPSRRSWTGYQVMNAADAARWGEVFITATGNLNVFRAEHFRVMRDGAVLANSGHFDAELELGALARAGRGAHPRGAPRRPGVRPRATASSTSSPRAGWSTSAPPRAIRRRSWT